MAKEKKSIIAMYMDWVLEKNEAPESVYLFTKENKMNEADFYKEFGSLKAVEKQVFTTFFAKTVELLDKDENYLNYDSQQKLLSFYFTFFELLTANRSYVLAVLPKNFKTLDKFEQLKGLREEFLKYVSTLLEKYTSSPSERWQSLKKNGLTEAAWAQFLFAMAFWAKDESANFEKTDVFIEKSLKATFELVETTPLSSVVDLGKFLLKEAMA